MLGKGRSLHSNVYVRSSAGELPCVCLPCQGKCETMRAQQRAVSVNMHSQHQGVDCQSQGLIIHLICRLFEPYIVQLMAKLLERFGDTSSAFRDATDGVARAVMANLSSQGDSLQGPLRLCVWLHRSSHL